jgi:hypothetical protein
MTATRDWTTYESKPSDTDYVSDGADQERLLKVDIRERMAVDHVWGVSTTTDGRHNQLTLPYQAADPTNAAGIGFVYTKNVGGGVIELYYEDAAGNVVKMTNAGSLNTMPLVTILGNVYPIGCIYTEITGVNPATTFGFGTWVAIGTGQVLVGYKVGDSDFGTVLGTGGEKTHLLTSSEMPAHTHPALSGTGFIMNDLGVYGRASGSGTGASTTTGSTGGGTAHNNLQPFVVVYFWRRTA